MNDEDKIIEESFNNFFKDKMPPNIWEGINIHLNKNEEDIENETIKSSFMICFDKEPSAEIWDNINEELNIDLTWDRLQKELNIENQNKKKRSLLFRIASIACLLLFISTCGTYKLGSFDLVSENVNAKIDNNIKTEIQNATSKESNFKLDRETKEDNFFNLTDINLKTNNSIHDKAPDYLKKYNHVKKRTANSLLNAQNNLILNSDGNNILLIKQDDISTINTSVDKEFNNNKNSNDTLIPENDIVLNSNEQHVFLSNLTLEVLKGNVNNQYPQTSNFNYFDNKQDNKNLNRPSFEFGLIMKLGSSIFLNYETLNALNTRGLNSTRLLLLPAYGVTTQLNLSSKHRIGLDFFIKETSAQRYFNYSSIGEYYKQDIEANYSMINFYYKFNNRTFLPKLSVFTKLGTSIAFLHPEKIRNGHTIHNNISVNKFTKTDIGVNLSLGASYQFGNFIFDFGIFAEQGLLNINKGSAFEPARFKVTRAFDFGLVSTIRYAF